MRPLTLLAAEKLVSLLTTGSALQIVVNAMAEKAGEKVPPLPANGIVVTSISPEMADKNAQLSYPRICVYCTHIKNTHAQKFRSFSGVIGVIAEIWSSGNLLADTATGLQYYVEALSAILRANQGDWADGFHFSGLYEVQFQPPKQGGFGFVESARVSVVLDANIS